LSYGQLSYMTLIELSQNMFCMRLQEQK